jgi:hypothetical protein
MTTVLTDLIEENALTPEQVIDAFFTLHSRESVSLVLLETFQGYAVNQNKGALKTGVSEEQIAVLFDSMIALVKAVDRLRENGTIKQSSV